MIVEISDVELSTFDKQHTMSSISGSIAPPMRSFRSNKGMAL